MPNPNKMWFKFGDREYRLKFRYEKVPDQRKKNKYRILTVAIIDPVNGGIPKVGFAYCSYKDNFCRETGRLLAIERAASPDGVDFLAAVMAAYESRKATAQCAHKAV